MAKDIKFNIRLIIDGKEQIVAASAATKDLSRQLSGVRENSNGLKLASDFNQIAWAAQNALSGVQQITGLMQTYTAATAIQQEAESKLANNMRNTMGASAAEVQSILDLCSAQQQLGVIGDEVQLSGAQELATYLEKKSSLEQLIPVMNDMLAQQYGLNATTEAAAQIATMLGKVMEGQTGALSRYGYKFDEAQEAILKFGTEEERAAVLADVVSSAVGGMNAALAETAAGKAKQAANDLGDLQEKIGSVFAGIEPYIIQAGQLGMAITGISTAGAGIASVVKAMQTLCAAITAARVASVAHTAAEKGRVAVLRLCGVQSGQTAAATRVMSAAMRSGAFQAVALKIALRGLLISSGVGIAIAAVTFAIEKLINVFDDGGKSAGDFGKELAGAAAAARSAEEAFADTLKSTKSELDFETAKLGALIKQNKATSATVDELNRKYGDAFGTHRTAAQWYDILTKRSAAYCRQLAAEARVKELTSQLSGLEVEQSSGWGKAQGMIDAGTAFEDKKVLTRNSSGQLVTGTRKEMSAEYAKLVKENQERDKEIVKLRGLLDNALAEVDKANEETAAAIADSAGSGAGSGAKVDWSSLSVEDIMKRNKSCSDDYAAAIQAMRTLQGQAGQEERARITENIALLEQQKAEFEGTVKATTGNPFAGMSITSIMASNMNSVAEFQSAIEELRKRQQTASSEQYKAIQDCIDILQDEENQFKGVAIGKDTDIKVDIDVSGDLDKVKDSLKDLGKEAESAFGTFKSGWGNVKGIGGGVQSLTDALEGNGNAWETLTGLVDGFISIYDGITGIINIINTLSGATDVMTAATTAATAAKSVETGVTATNTVEKESNAAASVVEAAASGVAATAATGETVADTGAAAAKVAKAHAAIPFVGIAIAAGLIATMVALIAASKKKVSKYAKGGIAYGPTLGLFGEYAGASHNPEVVAPLDKLRTMIGPMNVTVNFDLSDRKLGKAIEKYQHTASRR